MVEDQKRTKLRYRATTWQAADPPGPVALPRTYPIPMNTTYVLGSQYRAAFPRGRIVEVSESEHEYGESYTGPPSSTSGSDSDSDSSSSSNKAPGKSPNVFRFLQPVNNASRALVPRATQTRPPPLPWPQNYLAQPPFPYALQAINQPSVAIYTCTQCRRARSPEYHRTHPSTSAAKPTPGICRRCKRKRRKEKSAKETAKESGSKTVCTETVEREVIDIFAKRIRVEVKDDKGARKRYTVQRVSRSASPPLENPKSAPSRPESTISPKKRTIIYIDHKNKRSQSPSPTPPDRPRPKDPAPIAPSFKGFAPKVPASTQNPQDLPRVDVKTSNKSSPSASARDERTPLLSIAKCTPLPPSTPSAGTKQSDMMPKVLRSSSRNFSFRHVPAGKVLGTVRGPRTTSSTAHIANASTIDKRPAERAPTRYLEAKWMSPAASPIAHSSVKAHTAPAARTLSGAGDLVSDDEDEDHRVRWKRTIKGKPAAVAQYQLELTSHDRDKATSRKQRETKSETKTKSFSEKQQADIRAIVQDCYTSERQAKERIASHPHPFSHGRLVPNEEIPQLGEQGPAALPAARKASEPKALVIEIRQPPPHIIHIPADVRPKQAAKIIQRVSGHDLRTDEKGEVDLTATNSIPSTTSKSSNFSNEYSAPLTEGKSRVRKYVNRKTTSSGTTPSGRSTISSLTYAADDAAGPYHALPDGSPNTRARLFNQDGSMVTQATSGRPRLHNEDGTTVAMDTVLRHRLRNKDPPKQPVTKSRVKSAAREVRQEQQPMQETYYYQRTEYRDKSINQSPEAERDPASTSGTPQPNMAKPYLRRGGESHEPRPRESPSPYGSPSPQSESRESPQAAEPGHFRSTIRAAGRSLQRAVTLTPRPRSALRDSSRRRRKRCSSSDDKYVDGTEQEKRSRQSNRPQLDRHNTDQESIAAHVGDAQHAHFDAKTIEREEINGRENGRDYERDSEERSEEETMRRPQTKDARRVDAYPGKGRARDFPEELESMGPRMPDGNRRNGGGRKDERAYGSSHLERQRSSSPFIDDDIFTAKAKARDGTVRHEWSRRRISDRDVGV